ncbi:MAG: bifunctional glutamate N-acetyltransferase/amino-acid acetyltransferase ArgJ, partial [Oscillospiraceae bacterium]
MTEEIKWVKGGICAPKGFLAGSVHCGIRKNKDKKDLALILSRKQCKVACTYTQNKVKGAPILVTQANVKNGKAQAIICNSGNANTCNANGIEVAAKMCKLAGSAVGVDPRDVVVASTGVIGQPLDITPIENSIRPLVASLTARSSGSRGACEAIMTTDTVVKEFACQFVCGGKKVRIGAIVKGSGMIHPNMATMLAFLTTDCCISAELLQKCVSEVVKDTFNMVSVDGDTSTNDMLTVMANGMIENIEITHEESADYKAFKKALFEICKMLSRAIAKDGEGASKLLECTVTGAPTEKTAKMVAKSVITSSLFKAAMFGADANWGRVLCAIGYTQAEFDITKIAVCFKSATGLINVCKDGAGVEFDEVLAKKVLS